MTDTEGSVDGLSIDSGPVRRRRMPAANRFKQQALPAWKPFISAGTTLPFFLAIGLLFVPLGIAFIYLSGQVKEATVNYTNCKDLTGKLCYLQANSSQPCTCILPLDMGEEDWTGTVYVYYGLTNFYQNHRRYVKSRDDRQLLGDLESVDENCKPFLYVDPEDEGKGRYAPCGAIANSLFNDTIVLQYRDVSVLPSGCEPGKEVFADVPVFRTGIAWDTDKSHKFRNPPVPEGSTLRQVFMQANVSRPRDWGRDVWQLDTEDPDNNGFQNEDFIVWMRTAALPDFRKLYRRVNHKDAFSSGLPVKGGWRYRLKIEYSYNVKQFGGTKNVLVSTTSMLGGKNPFLGIAYLVVGFVCLLMSCVFYVVHRRFSRIDKNITVTYINRERRRDDY